MLHLFTSPIAYACHQCFQNVPNFLGSNINFFCTANAISLSSYSQYDRNFSLDICSANWCVIQFQLLAPICHFSYRPVVHSGRRQTAIHNMADLTSVVFGSTNSSISSSSSRHAVAVLFVVYRCRRPFTSERVMTVSQYPHTTVFTVCRARRTARPPMDGPT